ncbi:MAG TPA: Fe-S cluster assembly protein SufD [Cytophagales bacterium]|nr:Fe-S cluster assembly protein SufD [Cytophagales bacterium]
MAIETTDTKEAILSNIKNQNTTKANSDLTLLEARQEALQALAKLDLPTTKHEEWKYTDITKALKKNFDFNVQPGVIQYSPSQIDALKIPGLEAYYLVFLNGKFDKSLSSLPSDKENITVTTLSEGLKNNEKLIKEHFAKHVDIQQDVFAAISTAFVEDSLFVKVADNVSVEKPLVFLLISDSTHGNTVSQPRNLVYVGSNTEVRLIENYISVGDNPQFTNSISEIIVAENAVVDYYKIQNEKEHSFHVGTTQVHQSKNSNFSSTTITTNGGMVRNNLNIKLDGENANAFMHGLYLLNGKTHVDNHTTVDHAKPHSYSNELYKGVMNGKSRGVFNGKIYVRQDAQKTNAFQSNRNVLLSEDASINTKPQLEIWADDVKCTHGATTGQIDEEALFYLQSRGIQKDAAKALLMIAFASEIVQVIKIKELKKQVEHLIGELLHN